MNTEEFLKTHPKPWSNLDGKHVYDATEHYVNVDQLLGYITELEAHYKKVTFTTCDFTNNPGSKGETHA